MLLPLSEVPADDGARPENRSLNDREPESTLWGYDEGGSTL